MGWSGRALPGWKGPAVWSWGTRCVWTGRPWTAAHWCIAGLPNQWLDDGPPSDERLLAVAAQPGFRGLDVRRLLADFHAALARPAIAAASRRSTYAKTLLAESPVSRPRWQVWRERSFAIRDGDALLSGSIDRLVVLCDGDRPVAAEVLDFKTDALPADDTATVDARADFYRPQLAAYCRAAAALLGFPAGSHLGPPAFVNAGAVVAC